MLLEHEDHRDHIFQLQFLAQKKINQYCSLSKSIFFCKLPQQSQFQTLVVLIAIKKENRIKI
jgi:hypothetical protein